MPGPKKRLYKAVIFLFLWLFLVSCSASTGSKKPAGSNNPSNDVKISRMESDIVVIRQDQANLKSQMEDSNTGLQKLQEDLLRLEEKMAGLEKNRTAAGPAAYKIEQTTPAILYEKARNRVVEEKYLNAATLFTQMIRTYPKDSLADNAMYWLGECHYSLGKYQKAISVFKDLVTLYPKSEKVPDAILKTGYSYFSLGDSAEARQYLKQVLKEYPFSLSAEKAQEKLGDFD